MGVFLKVVRHAENIVDYDLSATFGRSGGNIGRSGENSLILPDTEGYVSRVHVKIECDHDVFFIADCSSNGTLLLEPIVDDPENAFNEVFINQNKRELMDGAYIVIGEFEIQVQYCDDPYEAAETINESSAHKVDTTLSRKKDPIQNEFTSPDFAKPITSQLSNGAFESEVLQSVSAVQSSILIPDAIAKSSSDNEPPEIFDIDDFFTNDEAETQPSVETTADDIFSVLQNPYSDEINIEPIVDHITAEPISEAVEVMDIPSDKEIPLTEPVPPVTEKTKVEPDISNQSLEVTFEAKNNEINLSFFNGLGLDVSKLPDNKEAIDKLMLDSGKMLRQLLEINISLLKARADLKKEFSSSLTRVKKEENNPLKFCNSIDDALTYLFLEKPPGFLSNCQAVNESVNDLYSHQMALMAGVQASLKGVVNKFDPEIVENECDAGRFNKSSKNWEYYQNNYKKMSVEALSDFFGSDFARAYESQVMALKNTQ